MRRLLIISEKDDYYLKDCNAQAEEDVECKVYEYESFSFEEGELLYRGKKFKGFTSSDVVLLRYVRFSSDVQFWVRTLASLAQIKNAYLVDSNFLVPFPHYNDKYTQAILFRTNNLAHPTTRLFSNHRAGEVKIPIILKKRLSTFGEGTCVVDTPEKMMQISQNIQNKNAYIAQSYFKLKRDVRVLIIGTKVYGVVERKVKRYQDGHIGVKVKSKTVLTRQEKRLVDQFLKVFSPTFSGLDVLTAEDGFCWIGEMNISPAYKGFERVAGGDVAKAITSAALA